MSRLRDAEAGYGPRVEVPLERLRERLVLRDRPAEVRLEPLDRETFAAAIEHCLKAAGATQKLLSDQAVELLFRASRGTLRVAAKILRTALRIGSDKGQAFLDEHILEAAIEEAAC